MENLQQSWQKIFWMIKDLSTKKGFEGRNYIRIAIRDEKDNEKLVAALKKKLN